MRWKMFNVRPYLNVTAVTRFQPLIDAVVHDMSDDELLEAHKALNLLTSMLTGEQIRREEHLETTRDTRMNPGVSDFATAVNDRIREMHPESKFIVNTGPADDKPVLSPHGIPLCQSHNIHHLGTCAEYNATAEVQLLDGWMNVVNVWTGSALPSRLNELPNESATFAYRLRIGDSEIILEPGPLESVVRKALGQGGPSDDTG